MTCIQMWCQINASKWLVVCVFACCGAGCVLAFWGCFFCAVVLLPVSPTWSCFVALQHGAVSISASLVRYFQSAIRKCHETGTHEALSDLADGWCRHCTGEFGWKVFSKAFRIPLFFLFFLTVKIEDVRCSWCLDTFLHDVLSWSFFK